MHGVPIPPHVYRTVPRALAELLFGADGKPDMPPEPEPRATIDDISAWLRDWRAHPSVEPETWDVPKDRTEAAVRLRFLRWAVREGHISDQYAVDAPRIAGLEPLTVDEGAS